MINKVHTPYYCVSHIYH